VPRHPVQLYESAAMAGFALVYILYVMRGNAFVIENGFYLAVGFYGAQRFALEFVKPYGPLAGPFTLFHLLSAAIIAYAAFMIATAPRPRTLDDTAVA
jgi:prolipoprotein diacylglyceryltransferase